MRGAMWMKRSSVVLLTLATSAGVIGGPFAGHASARPRRTTVTITAAVPAPGGGSAVLANGATTNQTSITLTLSSSVTGATFTCSRDRAASVSCTSPVTYTGLTDGSHSVRVQVSGSGYRRATATFSWRVDTVAPAAVTFNNVPTHAVATSPAITFNGAPGETYTCSIDGGKPVACTTGNTGTASVTGDGTHTLTVVPKDAVGNVGPANTASWTLDTIAPTVVINSAPAAVTNATDADVTFTVNDPTAIVTCTLNNVSVSCGPNSWSGSGLTNDTTYTLVVTATDVAGNHSSDSAQWKVDTTAATPPTLSSTPSGLTNQTVGSFSFATDDPTDTFQCALDPADPASPAWGDCSSGVSTDTASLPGNVPNLTDGTHAFFVRALDVASNPSSAVEYHWTVDTTPPTIQVSGVPSGATKQVDVTPVIAVTDAYPGTPTCTLAGPAPSSDCGPYSNLADGDYTLTVNDTDGAGNAATPVVDQWTVETVAPVATIKAPATITSPVEIDFTQPVTGAVVGLTHLAVAGGAGVAVSRTCQSAALVVPCTGSYGSVFIRPDRPLVPGQHYVAAVTAGIATDGVGNTADSAALTFRAQTALPANTAAATYQWRTVHARTALGGSYQSAHFAGATEKWSFTGPSLTWWTRRGPGQGKASVIIDGHWKATVNNFSKRTKARVARRYNHLGAGAHTVTIRVLGKRGAKRAKGTAVAVDGFSAGTKRANTPTVVSTWASDGKAVRSDDRGAQVLLTFRGTSFSWATVVGRSMGKAKVYVDRTLKATVNNYAATTKSVTRTVKGLTDAQHTIRIVVLGRGARAAKGHQVVIASYRVG